MAIATRAAYRPASPSPAIDPVDAFEARLRGIARRLRTSVPDLNARERDWLYDLAREEARYPMPTVRRLCRLARRSRSTADRQAFATLILEESTPDITPVVRSAFDVEAPTTGRADVDQRAFELRPDPVTASRCRDALERQLAATREALEAVIEWQRRNA